MKSKGELLFHVIFFYMKMANLSLPTAINHLITIGKPGFLDLPTALCPVNYCAQCAVRSN